MPAQLFSRNDYHSYQPLLRKWNNFCVSYIGHNQTFHLFSTYVLMYFFTWSEHCYICMLNKEHWPVGRKIRRCLASLKNCTINCFDLLHDIVRWNPDNAFSTEQFIFEWGIWKQLLPLVASNTKLNMKVVGKNLETITLSSYLKRILQILFLKNRPIPVSASPRKSALKRPMLPGNGAALGARL